MIEVAETLRATDSGAELIWVRREDNQLADDLTNEEFAKFDSLRRIRVTRDNCKWVVLDKLLPRSKELYDEIQNFKKEQSLKKRKDEEKRRGPKRKFFGRWHS